VRNGTFYIYLTQLDATATNWLIISYPDDKKDELALLATGEGQLDELTTHLKPEMAAFAYLRVNIANDQYSQRTKFVLIQWCGENVRVMRKAKLSIHNSEIKNVLHAYAIEVAADDTNELKQDQILLLLRKAGGANYDRQSSQY
jgi:hypothetical protein